MKTSFKYLLGVAIFSSLATLVSAEEAPVYDVDSYVPAEVQPEAVPSETATNSEPSQDQSWSPPPATNQTVQQRMARVEQQISNLQQSAGSSRIEALQNEVQSLRGQVEELTHQLQQTQTQQKTMYADLDKRLTTTLIKTPAASSQSQQIAENKKSKPISPPTPPSLTVAQKSIEPNVLEEQQTYQAAYDLIKDKKYTQAINTLQNVLAKYPKGQFAANAHYWLGELYGLLGKNDRSVAEFNTVVKNFPNSPKMSDALFKLGMLYATQGSWSDAKTAFKSVINRHPGTTSARLAIEQLKQIKLAGH